MSVADHADARALLGGARRVRTRVRGFAPWAPRGTTLELLEQVRGVLDEYEDYLPLTIRQIFYRLVGAYSYEKTGAPTGDCASTSIAHAVPAPFRWRRSAMMVAS